MSIESKAKLCPKCGAAIPLEAPQGLCPTCLLQEISIPTEVGQTNPGKPAPPSREELIEAFPQLEILELIGQGGMGFVFKARQPKLDRFVALKILPQSLAADPAFAERFTREGRLLARLNHPNIVTVHDFGQAKEFFYLLMEYVDGVNLRQAMRAGRFTSEQALAVVPKICEALQFAHNEGILHRDIKPENILLDTKGRVKIADFGIAKLISEATGRAELPLDPNIEAAQQRRPTSDELTHAGKTLGTPNYMAPEQIEKPGEVDHRADIYSLGVVFYEMLTGELPSGQFAPPSQKSSADPRLDDVVLRALEKEPNRRTQSADEVKTQVETIATNPSEVSPTFHPAMRRHQGVNYRSKASIFGLPLVHVATGADPATGKARVAKGIIAIGGIAKGFVAFGGIAMGGITFGGLSLGVFAYGGCALGLIALGGLAIALIGALGGGAIAPVALGGGAIGFFTYGGGTVGKHAYDALTKDPMAAQFFLPWAKTLMDKFQIINFMAMGLSLFMAFGVPRWLEGRLLISGKKDVSKSPTQKEPDRFWKRFAIIVGVVLLALILIPVIAMVLTIALPAISKSKTHPLPISQPIEKPTQPVQFGDSNRSQNFTVSKLLVPSPELLAEPPKLQFLAWQDEWKTNQPGAARHPDGSPVRDAMELGWAKHIFPTTKNVSALKLNPEPRFLHLWFSHPLFGPTIFNEVTLLDEHGAIIPAGTAGSSSGAMSADAHNGNVGWLVYTRPAYDGTNIRTRVTVRLRYTIGPLENTQQAKVEAKSRTSMTLESGGQLNGLGQTVDGNAFIAIAVNPEKLGARQFGAVAVTKDGRELPSSGGNSSGTADGTGVGVQNFEFDVPLKEVALFRIGTRPIRTVEWKNVVLPRLNDAQKLAVRIAGGDETAFTELRQFAETLYRNIDYSKDSKRAKSNFALMTSAFSELGEQAAKGNEKAFTALKLSLKTKDLSPFAPDALGQAAAAGQAEALEILLNYKESGILLSSAVFAVQPTAAQNNPKAIAFLIEVLQNNADRPLWPAAAQGLEEAASRGNVAAKTALKNYTEPNGK